VEIASSPAAAAVYLDGEPGGVTPTKLTLAPGTHRLVLAAEHQKLVRKQLSAGDGPVAVTLEPAKLPADLSGSASLKVRCKTHGELRIFVDGADSGLTCPNDERIYVTPGTHKIGLYSVRTGEAHEVEHEIAEGDHSTRIYVKY
jgi:hypothetical protein